MLMSSSRSRSVMLSLGATRPSKLWRSNLVVHCSLRELEVSRSWSNRGIGLSTSCCVGNLGTCGHLRHVLKHLLLLHLIHVMEVVLSRHLLLLLLSEHGHSSSLVLSSCDLHRLQALLSHHVLDLGWGYGIL